MLIITLDGKAREFVQNCCVLAARWLRSDYQNGLVCDDHYSIGIKDLLEIKDLTAIDGPIVMRDELLLMMTSAIDLMIASAKASYDNGAISDSEAELVIDLSLRVVQAYETAEEI